MLTVKERGQFVATMRYVHVQLMETLAAWVPTTPEMEVKLLFGEHIWDVAQHADALGKRTFELRLPLQHSVRPAEGYVELLADVAALGPTPERIAALYDVLVPALLARYRQHLDRSDALLDAPTVRIVERWVADTTRMTSDARALREELPALRLAEAGWAEALRAREAATELLATPETATVEA
ncbi:MAG TPA: hypothetical protein VII06_05145 [Chloroflexota bacterium]|jgi:hypothetical protein